MKKLIVLVYLFVLIVTNTFGQTTAAEWLKKADEYFDKGDYTNAIKAYSETIKRDDSEPAAYFFRGLAYYQTNNYDAAISDLNIVTNEIPDYSATYTVRGDVYGAKGLYHKAVADYKIGLEKGYDPSGFIVDKTEKSSMWFCGAMYMEIVINRFLGNSGAVNKYENWLKIVCDKNKISRAEVETFYRDNIRSLIAGAVNEEFNKFNFTLERGSIVPHTIYYSITRNQQNGKFELTYKSTLTQNQTRIITGNTTEELVREMQSGKNKSDFDQKMIDDIRTVPALIPTVVYADWKQKGVAGGVDALALITETVTNFYIDPIRANYEKVLGIYGSYLFTGFIKEDMFAQIAANSFNFMLKSLNNDLGNKANSDMSTNQQREKASGVFGSDDRFKIFTTPYDTGKR
jgi:hypothetical protein